MATELLNTGEPVVGQHLQVAPIDVVVRRDTDVAGQMKSKADAGEVGAPGFSRRVERRREYKIQDGPQGRRFIVRDARTGVSRTYRSLDEMPARHRDVFVRTLKSAGLWKGED